jgi:hypothetical protein
MIERDDERIAYPPEVGLGRSNMIDNREDVICRQLASAGVYK